MECEADEDRSFKALVSSSLQIEQMSLPNGKHIKWNEWHSIKLRDKAGYGWFLARSP